MTKKYLITTDVCFLTPDGKQYKSALGEVEIVSDSYSWLKKGITAYTFGAILTPLEIEILEVDFENKIATTINLIGKIIAPIAC